MISSKQRKTDLRKTLRARRLALSPAQQQSCAEDVARHISEAPFWQEAQTLAVYFAADGELDPAALVSLARIVGKSVYLPAITPDKRLEFRLWEPDTELKNNHVGIPEPLLQGITHKKPDLICLPVVGWNKNGIRLGMGGGYYDRYLQNAGTTPKVGLAYALQESAHLPRDNWDIALDFVVTERGIISCCS
ncbi:MAG: 5-formyltetrahydrofolate cyclo-ligase [Halieaceae bacterium]|jgi:5-formyltetrahydrofolate cyclo-ligase